MADNCREKLPKVKLIQVYYHLLHLFCFIEGKEHNLCTCTEEYVCLVLQLPSLTRLAAIISFVSILNSGQNTTNGTQNRQAAIACIKLRSLWLTKAQARNTSRWSLKQQSIYFLKIFQGSMPYYSL